MATVEMRSVRWMTLRYGSGSSLREALPTCMFAGVCCCADRATCQAIPVREALQSVYRIDRDKTLRDLCLFAFMLVLYAFITTNVLDVHEAWSTDAAVSDLLLDEEFGGVRMTCTTTQPRTLADSALTAFAVLSGLPQELL